MDSVAKISGVVREGHIVVPEMPFADGERVEMMVWSPKGDDLVPSPSEARAPEARVAAMKAWLERVKARNPRLPSLSDYSMSRECIYRDEEF